MTARNRTVGRRHAARLRVWGAASLLLILNATVNAQIGNPQPDAGHGIETYSGLLRTDKPAPISGSRTTNLTPPTIPDPPAEQTPPPRESKSNHNAASHSIGNPSFSSALDGLDDIAKPSPQTLVTPKITVKPPEPLNLAPSITESEPVKPIVQKPIDLSVFNTAPDISPPHEPIAEKTKPNPAPIPTAPDTKLQVRNELSEHDLYRLAMWQWLGTTVAMVLAIFLVAGLGLVFLRRFSARAEPLFRVEFSGPAMMPMAYAAQPMIAPPMPPAPPPPAPPTIMPAAVPEPSTAQSFDIGLTFEEELQLREQTEQQKDEAILQQILRDNVNLRELLDEADEAANFVDAMIGEPG